jgi:hypothetical protein
MGIMAKSLLYPGMSTLLMNLITSFSNVLPHEEREEGKAIPLGPTGWIKYV